VRTFCTVKAGIPGLSENITTRSILGRFLEHSRIYYFGGDGSPEYWIGSADLMHRNLDRRVELLCEVGDPDARAHLREVLDVAFSPDTKAWTLHPDGSWVFSGDDKVGLQELLMKRLADRGE
jgi:polyphosphate kinase